MTISYDNLWELLIDRKLKRTNLKDICRRSGNFLAKLGENKPISMESLEKICCTLNCIIENMMQFVKGDK